MKRLLSKALLSFLIIGSVTACSKAQSESQSQQKAAVQATFTSLDGKKVSVTDFKGKVVMLDFWETWCGPCIKSFPTLENLQHDYPEKFVVIAVNPGIMDNKSDVKKFVKQNNYDLHFVYDTNKLSQTLGIQSIPFKVFIGPNGKFIGTQLGSYGPKRDYKHIQNIIEKNS